jgi:hypothetical protein
MTTRKFVVLMIVLLLIPSTAVFAAYHHKSGQQDSDNVLEVYPELSGTKLDHCALCHTGGTHQPGNRPITLGSCQWCHQTYGYDGSGDITATMNPYGIDYLDYGRDVQALAGIENLDSDGDGYLNIEEIQARTYPGNSDDHPGLKIPPVRIYTRSQLEQLGSHTQFQLFNTTRSGDFYAQYTGVPMKDLLDDVGLLETATTIEVFAPDGWSSTHPLKYEEGSGLYHVYDNWPGEDYQYPPATFHYNAEADVALNPEYGWCDYSAPSVTGRSHGDSIHVDGGLKAILAYKREGAYLQPGYLSAENKLQGEGPFRMIVPQLKPSPPEQVRPAGRQDVIWPFNEDGDHNAGACTKSVTIIKVLPLPEGTADIDFLEAGMNFIDQDRIIVYGAIEEKESSVPDDKDPEENRSNSSSTCFIQTLLGQANR